MPKADRNRRFYDSIKREPDSDDTPVVRGRIKMQDGFVSAQAACQDELGSRLDELAKMVLDYGLHNDCGVTSMLAVTHCFLN